MEVASRPSVELSPEEHWELVAALHSQGQEAQRARTPGSSRRPSASARDELGLPPRAAASSEAEARRRPGAFQHSGQASIEQRTAAEREAQAESISDLLRKYFEPHETEGEDGNAHALATLIARRSRLLAHHGETRASVKAAFSKANQMDTVAAALRGALGSLAFAIAGLLSDNTPVNDIMAAAIDHVPGVRELPRSVRLGFVSGALSGVMDEVWDKALTSAMKDTQWLHGASEQLQPVMQEAKHRVQASLGRALAEHGFAIQTFRIRDWLRIGATFFGASKLSASILGAVLGMAIGGAGYTSLLKIFDDKHHRIGAAFFLGKAESDEAWLEQFQKLKHATWTDAVANGAGRLVKAIVDTPEAIISAPNSLTEAKRAMKAFGALGLGPAGTSFVADKVKEATMNASPDVSTLKSSLAQSAASTLVGLAWTSASLTTDPLVRALRNVADGAGDLARRGVTHAVGAGANLVADGGRAAWASANRVTAGAAELADRLGSVRLRRPVDQSSAHPTMADPDGSNMV